MKERLQRERKPLSVEISAGLLSLNGRRSSQSRGAFEYSSGTRDGRAKTDRTSRHAKKTPAGALSASAVIANATFKRNG